MAERGRLPEPRRGDGEAATEWQRRRDAVLVDREQARVLNRRRARVDRARLAMGRFARF